MYTVEEIGQILYESCLDSTFTVPQISKHMHEKLGLSSTYFFDDIIREYKRTRSYLEKYAKIIQSRILEDVSVMPCSWETQTR